MRFLLEGRSGGRVRAGSAGRAGERLGPAGGRPDLSSHPDRFFVGRVVKNYMFTSSTKFPVSADQTEV